MVKTNNYYLEKLIDHHTKTRATVDNNNKIENMFDREGQKKTDESQCLDTVGAICLDSKGNFASAISSGGILLKVKVFHYFIIFYEIFRIFFVSIQAA
jgi:isoaspartyl peptidase/L-asparaginase-like protein (Ntn-hydrolase superfamily)